MAAALPTPPTVPSHAGSNPVMAQAMLRITNPSASSRFYEALGMKLVTRLDIPDLAFSLFFFAYTDDDTTDMSVPRPDRANWLWSRRYPTVELTWNWPRDTFEESVKAAEGGDFGGEVYVNGNQEPKGFGHLDITVRKVGGVAEAMRKKGYTVVEEGEEEGGRGVVVLADPDGYHVRVIGEKDGGADIADEDPVFSAVMMRIKDPRSALVFFSNLGMKLMARIDGAGVTDYYLGYAGDDGIAETANVQEKRDWVQARRECLVNLVHNWGTEDKEEMMYTNGNTKPYRGFGHIGVIVDDIYATTDAMEKEGYPIVRKASPFKDFAEISFVAEPSTGYWVEVIKRHGPTPADPYAKPLPA